jgi:hypothetical protein
MNDRRSPSAQIRYVSICLQLLTHVYLLSTFPNPASSHRLRRRNTHGLGEAWHRRSHCRSLSQISVCVSVTELPPTVHGGTSLPVRLILPPFRGPLSRPNAVCVYMSTECIYSDHYITSPSFHNIYHLRRRKTEWVGRGPCIIPYKLNIDINVKSGSWPTRTRWK